MKALQEESYEMVLDELDGKSTLANTTTANNNKLVFSHILQNVLYRKGAGGG